MSAFTRTGKRVHSSLAYNRAWKDANISAGNCRDCKQAKLPGRARCEKCLKLHAGWEAKRRAKRALARANAKNAPALSAGRVCLMPGHGSIGKTD